APLATPDHLVFAATTLAQGIDWIGELTGATARPGGKHVAMGTHNALLRLGPRLYLEIIAIDPDGAKPARPRWFDLDDGDLRADLLERPRLVHWVARTPDIERAVAVAGYDPGPVLPFERGPYRWRITVPDDGSRPGRGVLPTLIQWDGAEHPADALPDSGLALEQLAASHSDPTPVRRSLAQLGLGEAIHVTYDRVTRLAAMLRTPRGRATL
ncbi:MAG TPA: VOC family protein, partial [Casimicrobiaceae bacterium]|nr:VOC family protein [Casimicrobiaceae bacterium]